MAGLALETVELAKHFGGVHAVEDVSMSVPIGQIHGVIGPNGAGKTTLLNVLSGVDRPSRGTYRLFSCDVTSWPIHRIVHQARVVRTFQTVRLFESMTALDNVMVAAATGSRRHGRRLSLAAAADRAWEIIARLNLEHVANAAVTDLSYGLRRTVEIGRALVTEPRLLLLDEPAAGLNATERKALGSLLLTLRQDGLTTILVEHQMDLVSATCDELTVLDFGSVICTGPAGEVISDPRVLSAYLGDASHSGETSSISVADPTDER